MSEGLLIINDKAIDYNLVTELDENDIMNDAFVNTTLIKEAISARNNSYSPYSSFMVGAALLTASNRIYRGCNIENAAYSPTNCAERTAFFKAVSEGEREFKAIAVAGWPKAGKAGYAYPCGVCRQVMEEFCDPSSFKIIVAAGIDDYTVHNLSEILPMGFGPTDIS